MSSRDARRMISVCAGMAALGAAAQAQVDATTLACPIGAAVKSPDGETRIAMIVGVSLFKHNSPLEGAVKDAGRMYDFLVNSPARTFPKENVCVLTNSKATYDDIQKFFRKALIDRAAGASEALFYYAGHGSALADKNNDETDRRDETLFLHDSSKQERLAEGLKYNQLRDDELNSLLAELYAKTKNVTVILDSCHSGSATRDFGDEKARFVESDIPAPNSGFATEDKASFAEFQPTVMAEAVFLAAARDSEYAKENEFGGKFTKALLDVLKRPDGAKITYDQLTARISAAMAVATNRQNPVLSGKGGRFIFSSDIPYKPRFDWVVARAAGGKLMIQGLPTIGMGLGAEFLILPEGLTEEDAIKPDIAKARVKATTRRSDNEWIVEPVNAQQNVASVLPGDYALMVRPSASARQLKLRLRPANQPGGIADPGAFVEMMKTPFKQELGVSGAVGKTGLINFEAPGYDFEVSHGADGALQVSDADGVPRNTIEKPKPDQGGANERRALANTLANHFQQLTLLADWKPNGGALTPNKSIAVSLVPTTQGNPEPKCVGNLITRTDWPKPANTPQRVPVCAFYQIKVKLDAAAPISLRIGASVLSANGDMLAYPRNPRDLRAIDTNGVELRPGDEAILPGFIQADVASLNKPEYVYVLGLPSVARGEGTANFEAAQAIPWHLLSTNKARTRDPTTKPKEVNEREHGTYTILRIMTVEGS